MAAEAAESLLNECKSIIEKYQVKSKFFENVLILIIVRHRYYGIILTRILFFSVDLQSWEKKIAEEKEQEYDNEEDIEIEEKITVSLSTIDV